MQPGDQHCVAVFDGWRDANQLNAHNGNVAVAVVYAALRSIERNGASVRIADVIEEARQRVTERNVHVA